MSDNKKTEPATKAAKSAGGAKIICEVIKEMKHDKCIYLPGKKFSTSKDKADLMKEEGFVKVVGVE